MSYSYIMGTYGKERENILKLPRLLIRGYTLSDAFSCFKSAPKIKSKIVIWMQYFDTISSKEKYSDSLKSIYLATNLMI